LNKNEFSSFVKLEGDTSRQLAKFLEKVLNEDSKLTKVLKTINQSIIATPFIRLKRAFPPDIIFEDKSGHWKIIVDIVKGQEVIITHKKAGASKDTQVGFEFTWELIMRFDWAMETLIEASLKTTGVQFDKGISAEKKKQVQKIIDNFK